MSKPDGARGGAPADLQGQLLLRRQPDSAVSPGGQRGAFAASQPDSAYRGQSLERSAGCYAV
ncbi:hypothetical protein D9M68_936320 [compost metagenome]